MDALGWDSPDIIIFTGDAYVDHPAFGAAVIGRILEREGFKVAIVPQPNWRDDLRDFKKLGVPRLFFAVTSGNMDSMVNHYTANKRLRSDDAYTAGGQSGNRPDYATKVYTKVLKQLFPNTPIILGGIEASLRRLTHYDYWSDSLMPGMLAQTDADILVYGMGERPIVEIAKRLSNGESIKSLTNISQTAYLSLNFDSKTNDQQAIILNSFEDCLKNKKLFGENFKQIEIVSNSLEPKTLVEKAFNKYTVVNTPYPPVTEYEIDSYYNLPYTRLPHPRYGEKKIPAWEMIKFSVNIHRGCFGGCSFCTISAHQGKFVSSRSEKSILDEIEAIKKLPNFKGYISDLGGPSANMYGMKGIDDKICKKCKRPSCIFPSICKNLNISHSQLLNLYQRVREQKGIKKVFIGSGIRYDLFIQQETPTAKQYLNELIKHHVSGRLKVAPEHTDDEVLKQMRKPSFKLFKLLKKRFDEINKQNSLNQQLVPYFISSHPGCTMEHMQRLADEIRKTRIEVEPVQDFTPTPMTLASTIYFTGIDPYSGNKVYVARNKEEKNKQKNLFFPNQNTSGTKVFGRKSQNKNTLSLYPKKRNKFT